MRYICLLMRSTLRRIVLCVFFFQAEDGIRDRDVTGVQTCALPIFASVAEAVFRSKAVYGPALRSLRIHESPKGYLAAHTDLRPVPDSNTLIVVGRASRSEERRVGKGWRLWERFGAS